MWCIFVTTIAESSIKRDGYSSSMLTIHPSVSTSVAVYSYEITGFANEKEATSAAQSIVDSCVNCNSCAIYQKSSVK